MRSGRNVLRKFQFFLEIIFFVNEGFETFTGGGEFFRGFRASLGYWSRVIGDVSGENSGILLIQQMWRRQKEFQHLEKSEK